MSGRPASPHTPASAEEPVVFVVDDDASMRDALSNLFRSVGLRVEVFGSAHEFLQSTLPDVPSCLILDVSLPGLNGLDLQKRIADRVETPIIFITGHGSIPLTVQAMRAGAVEFLTKPFTDTVLLDAIHNALERSKALLERDEIIRDLKSRYRLLTSREREVLLLVVSGLPNKQIGGELGISEITVKAHRGKVMQKMKANSLPDLVKMAEKLRMTIAPRI